MAFSFLDIIFPKRCVVCGRFGSYFCKDCLEKVQFVDNPVCAVCQRQAIGGRTHPGCRTRYGLDGLIVGLKYRGPVKAAIRKIKYKWVWDVADELVDIFSKNIWRFEVPNNYVLVPIPLHKKRFRWRGFNQAELLCKILSTKFGVNYFDYLERILETKTQVGLSRLERKANIKGAFKVKRECKQTVILVDDVFTTGATLEEACRVLKKTGIREVWGMAIAIG